MFAPHIYPLYISSHHCVISSSFYQILYFQFIIKQNEAEQYVALSRPQGLKVSEFKSFLQENTAERCEWNDNNVKLSVKKHKSSQIRWRYLTLAMTKHRVRWHIVLTSWSWISDKRHFFSLPKSQRELLFCFTTFFRTNVLKPLLCTVCVMDDIRAMRLTRASLLIRKKTSININKPQEKPRDKNM